MTDDGQDWQRLVRVFREVFEDDALEIRPETTADDVDAWDSLSHVTLVLAVEREFGVKLSAAAVAKLGDVGALFRLATRRSA